jgi:hypothetical protein
MERISGEGWILCCVPAPADVLEGVRAPSGRVVGPEDLPEALRHLLSESGGKARSMDARLFAPAPTPSPGFPGEDDSAPLEAPSGKTPPRGAGQEDLIRPRLSAADAALLARRWVIPFRSSLRWIPYYAFPYCPRTAGPRSPSRVELVAVHGITGRAERWTPAEREIWNDPNLGGAREEPVVGRDQAWELARSALREWFSREVDHTVQHGETLIIERRKIPPSEEELELGTAILLYSPVWVFEGLQGRVMLDAVTGEMVPTPSESDEEES